MSGIRVVARRASLPLLVALTALGTVLSCNDLTAPLPGGPPSSYRSELVDGRNGGTAGFYFLPPLAPAVPFSGTFDPTRSPTVEVCALTDTGACGTTIARFTQNAKGPERIRVDLKDQLYIVNWKTKNDLSLNTTYRIRVLDGSFELGHADARLVKKGKNANAPPAGVVGVDLGSTLPIKFRIAAGGGPAVRLEIHPSAFLLTGAGQAQQLQVKAFDAQGQPAGGAVTWTSSSETVLTVSPSGVASAVAGTGSAQVTAQIGELTSAPALGLITQPPAGAMLVSDEQVVSAGGTGRLAASVSGTSTIASIVPVDANAPYVPGWQYRVRLIGVTPAVGQILLASGESPIGGRVVSVSPAGDEVEVTLALLPLREMLPTLSINESISLKHSEVVTSHSVLAAYDLQHQVGGTFMYAPRSTNSLGSRGPMKSVLHIPANPLYTDVEFDLGPFECKISGAVGTSVSPTIGTPVFHINPDLTLDLTFTPSGGLEKLVVHGSLNGDMTFDPVFPVAMEEKIECKVQLATIILPIGGPLALFIGGQVPVGMGFELGGKLSIGNVGYDAFVTAGAALSLGIDCTNGCGAVANLTGNATGYFKPTIPTFSTDARSELAATGFAYAELSIGNAFLQALQFKSFEAKAGLKQEFKIASPTAQVDDAAYASSFKFSFDVEAGTGSSLTALAGLLSINLAQLKLENSTPLAQSPSQQAFTISPAHVQAQTATVPGDNASFILTLDPVTYFGSYTIESVELFRKKTTGPGTFVLEAVPGGCGQLSPSNGQSAFSCQTTLPTGWAGAQEVYAFVKPKLFGVSLPLLLEIAADGKAIVTVDVSTVAVFVSPASITVPPGGSQQFTAAVTGTSNQSVVWTATAGSISQSGLFSAGAATGSVTITATSSEDPTKAATATVVIGLPATISHFVDYSYNVNGMALIENPPCNIVEIRGPTSVPPAPDVEGFSHSCTGSGVDDASGDQFTGTASLTRDYSIFSEPDGSQVIRISGNVSASATHVLGPNSQNGNAHAEAYTTASTRICLSIPRGQTFSYVLTGSIEATPPSGPSNSQTRVDFSGTDTNGTFNMIVIAGLSGAGVLFPSPQVVSRSGVFQPGLVCFQAVIQTGAVVHGGTSQASASLNSLQLKLTPQ